MYNEDAVDLYDLGPEFRAATCDAFDDPERCLSEGVAYISTPAALPVLAVIAVLPTADTDARSALR